MEKIFDRGISDNLKGDPFSWSVLAPEIYWAVFHFFPAERIKKLKSICAGERVKPEYGKDKKFKQLNEVGSNVGSECNGEARAREYYFSGTFFNPKLVSSVQMTYCINKYSWACFNHRLTSDDWYLHISFRLSSLSEHKCIHLSGYTGVNKVSCLTLEGFSSL